VLVMDSLLPATTDERGMRRIRPNQYQVWIL
jgi:hypothetical protein